MSEVKIDQDTKIEVIKQVLDWIEEHKQRGTKTNPAHIDYKELKAELNKELKLARGKARKAAAIKAAVMGSYYF